MYLPIIILPLITWAFSWLLLTKVGFKASYVLACGSVITTTLVATIAFVEVGLSDISIHININISIGLKSYDLLSGFTFNALNICIIVIVLIVSSLIHTHTIEHVCYGPAPGKFYNNLSLLNFIIIIAITCDNDFIVHAGFLSALICYESLSRSWWYIRVDIQSLLSTPSTMDLVITLISIVIDVILSFLFLSFMSKVNCAMFRSVDLH